MALSPAPKNFEALGFGEAMVREAVSFLAGPGGHGRVFGVLGGHSTT